MHTDMIRYYQMTNDLLQTYQVSSWEIFHVVSQIRDLVAEPSVGIVWQWAQWHLQLDWKKKIQIFSEWQWKQQLLMLPCLMLKHWRWRKSPCHFWKWKHQRLFKTMFFFRRLYPNYRKRPFSSVNQMLFWLTHSQGNENSIRLVSMHRSLLCT